MTDDFEAAVLFGKNDHTSLPGPGLDGQPLAALLRQATAAGHQLQLVMQQLQAELGKRSSARRAADRACPFSRWRQRRLASGGKPVSERFGWR